MLPRIPRDRPRGTGSLDVDGALAATALGAIALGLTGLGESGGLEVGSSLATLAAGSALFAGRLAWERRARDPIVDLSLFECRPFAGANALTLLPHFALSGVLFAFPMTLMAGWGRSEAAEGTVFCHPLQ